MLKFARLTCCETGRLIRVNLKHISRYELSIFQTNTEATLINMVNGDSFKVFEDVETLDRITS